MSEVQCAEAVVMHTAAPVAAACHCRMTPVVNYKVMVIGDSGVGKSSLTRRYIDDTFSDSYNPSSGGDAKIKFAYVDPCQVNVEFVDTDGKERFGLDSEFYTGANGVIFVYDIANKESFDNVKKWVAEVDQHAKTATKFLIGNKTDLNDKRVVSTEDGKAAAEGLRIPFFEMSAKDSTGVKDAFDTIPEELERARRESESKQ